MIITSATNLAPALPRDIKVWVDAYTMQLEASYAAAMDSRLKAEVADAVKQSTSDAKAASDGTAAKVQNTRIAENQLDIQAKVSLFNIDAYHAMRAAWARLSLDLIATGFDLAEEIGFELADGSIRMQMQCRQGDPRYTGPAHRVLSEAEKQALFEKTGEYPDEPVTRIGKPLIVQREVAKLAYAFLLWVEETQDKADPREHVKRVLAEQGIGPDNFDQHAGRLGITNPWATGPINKVLLP